MYVLKPGYSGKSPITDGEYRAFLPIIRQRYRQVEDESPSTSEEDSYIPPQEDIALDEAANDEPDYLGGDMDTNEPEPKFEGFGGGDFGGGGSSESWEDNKSDDSDDSSSDSSDDDSNDDSDSDSDSSSDD